MIRVLVVDDSAVVRRILEDELSRLPDIQVVATAADPFEARDLIAIHGPDVITLDIEMPKMNGLSFLERIMRSHPMPVVVVSSLTQGSNAAALRALTLGAVEVVPKPGASWSAPDVAQRLARAIRVAAVASLRRLEARPQPPQPPPAPTPVPGGMDGMAALLNRGNGGAPSTRMIELGAAVDVLPLGEIGEAVLKAARSGTDGVRTRMASRRSSPGGAPALGVNREGVAP